MALLLDGLDLLSPGGLTESGAPLRLPISSIDEDPDQPRQEFDDESLTELAATIRERGVRQPVSVREHPAQLGRWMLNFGARRLRASKLAELSEIPAFIDNAADSYDQVIENEQRKGLTPLELALFVQRRLTAGDSQAEIARHMGKSRQFVTMATALIDAPDWLMAAYREGRCRGLNELYELRKLAGSDPQAVEAWTSDRDTITRDRVMSLRANLASRSSSVRAGASALIQADAASGDASTRPSPPASADAPPVVSQPATRRTPVRLRLIADLDGVCVVVETASAPSSPGHLFVRAVGASDAQVVEARRLKLTGLMAD